MDFQLPCLIARRYIPWYFHHRNPICPGFSRTWHHQLLRLCRVPCTSATAPQPRWVGAQQQPVESLAVAAQERHHWGYRTVGVGRSWSGAACGACGACGACCGACGPVSCTCSYIYMYSPAPGRIEVAAGGGLYFIAVDLLNCHYCLLWLYFYIYLYVYIILP